MASLSDISKSISMVWEITTTDDAEVTRFVYNEHSGLDHSGADTVFYGAEPRNEVAPQFDPKTGRITVGRFDFSVVDKNQLVSAWLREFDATLAKSRVRRLVGLYGEDESTYSETFWSLEDYHVSTKGGGGFQFSCDNVLKQMSISVHDGHAGKGKLNADLNTTATTITLEDAPSSSWPTSGGFGLLYDTGTKDMELFTYTGIATADLTGVTRAKWGVGGSTGTGTAFTADACEVYHVWVKRGNPLNVMLELLTSTEAAGASTPIEQVLNPYLNDWSSATNADTWIEDITGGTVNRESVEALKTYCVRLDKTALDEVFLYQDYSLPADALGKWHRVSALVKADVDCTFSWQISNVTTADYLQDDGTWTSSVHYRTSEIVAGKGWKRITIEYLIPDTFTATDSMRVTFGWFSAETSGSMYIENESVGMLVGPFDSEPNGPWDVGDGAGVGSLVRSEYVNFGEIETVKWANTEDPVFDGNDEELSSGNAVLFVEVKPIEDVKKFVESHLLRPFGFKPLIDRMERFTIGTYFDVVQDTVAVGNKWLKKKFSASKWKRNWANKVNNIRLLSDWDPVKGENSEARSATSPTSVKRYGKAKQVEVSGRGCRTGLNGFPDYGSAADMDDAVSRVFLEMANPFTQVDVETFYEFRDTTLKNTVLISIPTILDLAQGVRGVTDKAFFVDKKIVDNQMGKVKMTLRERRPIARPAFIASNSAATDYTSASALERDSGAYIAPGSQEKFDNGDEGYTVIGSD